jgi:hypothetical protein
MKRRHSRRDGKEKRIHCDVGIGERGFAGQSNRRARPFRANPATARAMECPFCGRPYGSTLSDTQPAKAMVSMGKQTSQRRAMIVLHPTRHEYPVGMEA